MAGLNDPILRQLQQLGTNYNEYADLYEQDKYSSYGMTDFDRLSNSINSIRSTAQSEFINQAQGMPASTISQGGNLLSNANPIMSIVSAVPSMAVEAVNAFKYDKKEDGYVQNFDDYSGDNFKYDLADDYLQVGGIGQGISQTKSALGLGASWGAKGASVGTAFLPGIGTAIGAGVGFLAGAITGNLGAKRRERQARKRRERLMRQLDAQRSLFNTANTRRDYAREQQNIALSRYYS